MGSKRTTPELGSGVLGDLRAQSLGSCTTSISERKSTVSGSKSRTQELGSGVLGDLRAQSLGSCTRSQISSAVAGLDRTTLRVSSGALGDLQSCLGTAGRVGRSGALRSGGT